MSRAVLFDLDGTLVDTAPDLGAAANTLRADRDLPALPIARLAPMCSFGARGMLERALGLAPEDDGYDAAYTDFIRAYEHRMTVDSVVYPGMRTLLRRLVEHGWYWGVITNKAEHLARPLMKHLDFDPAPSCIIGGDTASAPKPDPAPIHLGLEQASADAAASIYIGDSGRDMQAGRAAGLATVGVAYGYVPENDDIHAWPADRIVHTVGEIEAAITYLTAVRATSTNQRVVG